MQLKNNNAGLAKADVKIENITKAELNEEDPINEDEIIKNNAKNTISIKNNEADKKAL